MSLLKNSPLYVAIILAAAVVGVVAGAAGGLGLGWAFSLGYVRRGPDDVADAPAYVGLGLGMFGAVVGVVAGFAIGIALCVVHAARKAARHTLPPPPAY